MLTTLGRIARTARRLGLGDVLAATRDFLDRIPLALGRPPLRTTVAGVPLRGYLRHRSLLAEMARDTYERLPRSAFLDGLDGADIVVDVGAHVGFYTLLAATRNPSARVIAVEPDPYNLAALRANVRRAGVSNVEIVPAAVSDRTGHAPFQQSLGTIGSSLISRDGTGPSRQIEVETTTVDSLVGSTAGRTLLVKLDVEGAELLAVRGAVSAFREAAVVTALLELNPRALEDSGASQDELLRELYDLDLSVMYLDDALAAAVPIEGPLRKGNLLCRRGEAC